MFYTGITNNRIIVINRGDTFSMLLTINMGEPAEPIIYFLSPIDIVYFSICEPNQEFEEGVVRKKYTSDNQLEDGSIEIVLNSSDTEHLMTGTYYYEIKLKIGGEEEIVNTLVPKRKLVMC